MDRLTKLAINAMEPHEWKPQYVAVICYKDTSGFESWIWDRTDIADVLARHPRYSHVAEFSLILNIEMIERELFAEVDRIMTLAGAR